VTLVTAGLRRIAAWEIISFRRLDGSMKGSLTMIGCRSLLLAAAAALALGALGSAPAPAIAADGPPACALIKVRPLVPGGADGEQEAGMYRSRFGHLELKASVKSGEAQDYYLTAGGKKLGAVTNVPAAAANCAKEKKMPAPAKAAAASCTGQRFATVIAHSGKDRVALLYGLKNSQWEFCSAGTLEG
jgi:hypothetical protein